MLTEHQQRVMSSVLAQESARRTHVVVSLSGAHAYGFPSPDSDLDLKAIHLEATRALLGLEPPVQSADRLEVIDGVEIDYTSNELGPVLAGVLLGNGNYIERVLGHLQPVRSAWLEPLQLQVQANLSRRIHRHYAGFAKSQLKEWEASGFASAKKLLYVLRTALTGTHALKTGEVQTDVTQLLGTYGFEDAHELVEQKRRGELASLPPDMAQRWREKLDRAFRLLDEARDASPLPEKPREAEALEAWLIEVRVAFRA